MANLPTESSGSNVPVTVTVSNAQRDLIAGLVAGGANTLVGFPFDTLKVRLQAERGVYRGSLHCLLHILKFEGITHGLYRGLTPPLIGGALETGVNYLVFHRMLNYLKERSSNGMEHKTTLSEVALAGGVAGACLSPILGPFELIKCRMQIAKGLRFRRPLDCIKWTIQHEGILGLTRGIMATMFRELPGNSVFFLSYEVLRRSLPGRPSDPTIRYRTIWEIMGDATSAILCGGLSGILTWLVVLPLDVAKTRLQASTHGEKYNVRITRQLIMLWQEGKWRALYSGLVPTLIRTFPASAVQWLTWEVAIDQLKRLDHQQQIQQEQEQEQERHREQQTPSAPTTKLKRTS
eukprot:g8755.t1